MTPDPNAIGQFLDPATRGMVEAAHAKRDELLNAAKPRPGDTRLEAVAREKAAVAELAASPEWRTFRAWCEAREEAPGWLASHIPAPEGSP